MFENRVISRIRAAALSLADRPKYGWHTKNVRYILKGHESGQGAFVKLVGGVGAGGGVEGRGL